jgi:hypothetical protein
MIYKCINYKLSHSTGRPGIMIVAYNMWRNRLPIEVLSTENWTVLKAFSYHTLPAFHTIDCNSSGYVMRIYFWRKKSTWPCKLLMFMFIHTSLYFLPTFLVLVYGGFLQIWNHGDMTSIENSEHERLLLC